MSIRLLALALALAPVASAQVGVTLTPLTSPIYAGQYPEMTLTVRNRGKTPVTVGNVLKGGRIPCPTFKVFDRAGGAPLVSPVADCVVGDRVSVASGQAGIYRVQLPISLSPGEYTAVMTVPTEPRVQYARTTLRVGPGPFVAELRSPPNTKAGAPLSLEVAFHNVWRTTQQKDLRLCGLGLMIRDENGRVVHDNQPEQVACTANVRPSTVKPGGVHVEKWFGPGTAPRLPAGRYTAVMWGWGSDNSSLHFQVLK